MSKEDEKLNQRRLIDQSALIQNIGVLKTAKFQNIKTGPLVAGISLSEEGSLENSGITINKLYNFKEFIKAYSENTNYEITSRETTREISIKNNERKYKEHLKNQGLIYNPKDLEF